MGVYIIIRDNELYHYGVKGMRWGVRHDKKPSPRRYVSGKTDIEKKKNKGKNSIRTFIKNHPYITVGLAITASYLALKGGTKLSMLYKQGYLTQRFKPSDIIKTLPTSEAFNMNVVNKPPGLLRSVTDKLSQGKSVLQMNPTELKSFNKSLKDGWYTNCVHCTNASALRRKGYDVVANNSPGGGHPSTDVVKWWHGSKLESIKDFEQSKKFVMTDNEKYSLIEDVLKSQGKGAYGDFHVLRSSSGHSVEYKVTDKGIKIYDYQVRRSYDSLKNFFDDSGGLYDPLDSKFIRLDNCKPNIDQMLKDHIIKPR